MTSDYIELNLARAVVTKEPRYAVRHESPVILRKRMIPLRIRTGSDLFMMLAQSEFVSHSYEKNRDSSARLLTCQA